MHADNCYSCHSEMNIIRSMYNSKKYGTENNRKRKKKYDIVIYRYSNGGQLVNAKPCLSCSILIKNCGFIDNVYYSTIDHDFTKVSANNITKNAELLYRQITRNNMVVTKLHSSRFRFLPRV